MIKTTTNDLLFYAYNESDLKDSDRIQRSIDGDPLVQEAYREILESMIQLDAGRLSPGRDTIEKILAFAKED